MPQGLAGLNAGGITHAPVVAELLGNLATGKAPPTTHPASAELADEVMIEQGAGPAELAEQVRAVV